MDTAAMYAYVRTSLDSDSSELPDDLLAVWAQEAFSRIKQVLIPSDDFNYNWPLSVVASQQMYPLSAFSPAVDTISGISSPQWLLQPIEHETAEELWQWNQDDDGAGQFGPLNTGNPSHWSVWSDDVQGNCIFLWPVPSTAQTFQVRGQRVNDTTGGVDTATLIDAELHPLACEYMVARGHEMQSNVTVAAVKFNRFEAELDQVARARKRIAGKGVTTIGGGSHDSPALYPFGRLLYPWE